MKSIIFIYMYNRKTLQIEETKRNRRKQNKKTNKRQSKDTFHFETLNKIKTTIKKIIIMAALVESGPFIPVRD